MTELSILYLLQNLATSFGIVALICFFAAIIIHDEDEEKEHKKAVRILFTISLICLIIFILMPSNKTFKKLEAIELAKMENNVTTKRQEKIIKLFEKEIGENKCQK